MTPQQKLHKKHKSNQRKRVFRKWHRRIGFTASLFLINLAVTGLLLNHYQAFSLHQTYVSSEWLLDWYGVSAPEQIVCTESQPDQENPAEVCSLDTQRYLVREEKHQRLPSGKGELIGLYSTSANPGVSYYLIDAELVQLFDPQFRLIDQFDFFQHTNQTISGFHVDEKGFELLTEQQIYGFDPDLMQVSAYPTDSHQIDHPHQQRSVQTAHLYPLAQSSTRSQLETAYRQSQITQLKLIQDLHSGQLLKLSGKLITDLAGLAILALALSGLITWQRRKNQPEN